MAYFRKRGCICKDKKKCSCGAKWSFTIDAGIDPETGKRKQITKSGFSTKKEAETAAASIHTELNQGTHIKETDMLFVDFTKEWLDIYSKGNVKISTVRVRKHEVSLLIPYFKHTRIKDITKKGYQAALNKLSERGLADNTISGAHSTGRMIFKKAIEFDMIKVDPTEFARVPKRKKTVEEIETEEREKLYLEKDELARFLHTVKDHGTEEDYPRFLVLAYTGMRLGELCALKWRDINFEEGTINITKTLYNPSNNYKEYTLLTPKTKKSKREIEVDQIVLKELEKHRGRQNLIRMGHRLSYHDEDFVFPKTNARAGYPEFMINIETWMKKYLKLAGLDQNLTPHSLRHTHTSLLAEAGVSLLDIMDRLGHKDDNTTKFIYLHVTKTKKKEASQKFAELMRNL